MKTAIILVLLLTLAACSSSGTDEPTTDQNMDDNSDLEVPERPAPDNFFCEDTDEGVDILTKGTVTSDLGVFTDTCQEDYKLREYYCDGDTADSSERRCAQGPCVDGACTIEQEDNGCTDTDGGSFFDKAGTATGIQGDAKADYCEDGILYEAYCDYLGVSQYKEVVCDVCQAGECVQEKIETQFGDCTDTDGGSNYNLLGTTSDNNGRVFTDTCLTEKLLEEGYCDTYGLANTKTTRCDCQEGVCIGTI